MIISFVVITCIAAGIFVGGMIYVWGIMGVKAWVLDEKSDNYPMDYRENNALLRLPSMPKTDSVTWWFESWAIRCLLLWGVLLVVWLSYHVAWVFLLIAVAVVIIGGLHFTRWVVRLKKSLGKLKSSSHEHGD